LSFPAPALTIEGVDALLAAWEARLRRMDENLIALEGDDTYQLLAGKAGRRAPLLGVTRERVLPALDAVTELFQQREQLADVVDRARAARASISALTFWDREEKLALVVRLLRTPSIDLGVRALPLAERSLLDEPERELVLEPEALLAGMVRDFERARDVILSVGRAWAALGPWMDELGRELEALRALAARVGGAASSEIEIKIKINAAERALAALAELVQKDPLGCAASPARPPLPELAALRSRLEAEAATAERVARALDHARAQRRSLAEVHARAEAAFAEASRAIEDAASCLTAPLDAPRLGGLDAWLEKLAATAAAHRYAAAEIGLARFHETAEGYLASEHRAEDEALAATGARAELQGRLSARRAQAAALAARAGVDLGLDLDPAPLEARARDAERLLRAPPIPLARARRAVEAYEAAVLALSRR
jgi:hypothetical protein